MTRKQLALIVGCVAFVLAAIAIAIYVYGFRPGLDQSIPVRVVLPRVAKSNLEPDVGVDVFSEAITELTDVGSAPLSPGATAASRNPKTTTVAEDAGGPPAQKIPVDVGHRGPTEGAPSPTTDNGNPKKGTLDKEAIRSVIKEMTPAVRECYQDTLKDFPEADGKITLGFTIVGAEDGKGHVDLEKISEDSTLHETQLHDCLLENLRNREFPVPEGGGEVTVRYPFEFASKADKADAGK